LHIKEGITFTSDFVGLIALLYLRN